MLHLRVHKYGIILHGVGAAQIAANLEEERRALGSIGLGDLAKTDVGASEARPP